MSEKTVLVVDDSASMRHVLEDLLKGAGYRVIVAEHGQDALTKARGETIHLVLSDVNMPVMDGIEFVDEFKQQSSNEHIPVVMLTTEADPELKNAAKQAGAKGWIIKPFDNEQLLNAITRLIL